MEMTLVLVTPPQIKDIVLSHSCCETSMDGSAKKRRLLKEVLLDICIKCTVWKAECPNNRKNRVYWVYVRKTAQKWNLCCCIRKNHIFPHLLRQDLTNPWVLNCQWSPWESGTRVPLHIRAQHPRPAGNCRSFGNCLSLKAHWTSEWLCTLQKAVWAS